MLGGIVLFAFVLEVLPVVAVDPAAAEEAARATPGRQQERMSSR